MAWTDLSPALLVGLALLVVLTGCLGAGDQGDAGPPVDDGDVADSGSGNGTGSGEIDAPGWPPVEQARIRPGSKIVRNVDDYTGLRLSCTANFVFSNPRNTTLYLGVAAHCVDGFREIGDPIWVAGIPEAGRLAYCSYGTMVEGGIASCPPAEETNLSAKERDNDFALVEILEEYRDEVHPAIRVWGGPTGIAEPPGDGVQVLSYGNSSFRDANEEAAPEQHKVRQGQTVMSPESRWVTHAFFDNPNINGDSGSPVIQADGAAVGEIAYTSLTRRSPPGSVGIRNLAPMVDFVNTETNLTIELKTWPLLPDGILPLASGDPATAPDR